jgi:hypothetical protein
MKLLLLTGALCREAVRNKVLWLFALAGVLMVAAALILGEMVVGRPGKAVWDLGLSAINLLGLAVVVSFGVSMSSPDLEGRMMQLLLVKPLSRRQYLLSVFLSLQLLVALASVLMGLLVWALLGFSLDTVKTLIYAGIWNQLEMSVMSAVTLFCSVMTSPQLAMFLSLCFYLIGHALQEALRLIILTGEMPARALISFLYFILPNLTFFDHKRELAAGLAGPSTWTLVWAVLYAGSCVLLWGWLAVRILERKEL